MLLNFKIRFKNILHFLSVLALILYPVFASLNADNNAERNNLYAASQDKSQAPGHEQLSAATRILKLDYTQTSLQQIQQARALLEQAVQLGNKGAVRILADLLFVHSFLILYLQFGRRIKPEFGTAVKLYTQLADESGDPAAQHMLGLAHFEGLGVEFDFAKVPRRVPFHTLMFP